MSTSHDALDELEREMNRYLNNVEGGGPADLGPVLLQSARVQMEVHDLSQRVQQKSISLEDAARTL